MFTPHQGVLNCACLHDLLPLSFSFLELLVLVVGFLFCVVDGSWAISQSGLIRLSGAEVSLTLLLAQRYNGFFPLTILPLGDSLWPPEWQDHEGND